VSCVVPRLVLGARNARIAFLVRERNAAGKLVPVDLTPAATAPGYVTAFFRKPSGAVVSVLCKVETPASSGVARYLTEAGFLDEAGRWEAQAHVHLAGAPTVGRGLFPSELVEFEVVAQLRPFAPAEASTPASAVPLPLALPSVTRT
jgi:hypothetical protein